MIYRFVQIVEGQLTTTDFAEQDVISEFAILGFVHTGATDNSNGYAELRGAPKFSGVFGPAYGGPGIVRYETWDAYNRLST
jgi:hypothetical protein